MTTEPFRQLVLAAAGQGGLMTGAQATRLKVDSAELARLAGSGLLLELDWDVYQLTSSSLAPRYAYPYGAWLALVPELLASERPAAKDHDAVLSHGSAARLHGLGAVSAPTTTFIAPTALALPRAVEIQVTKLLVTDITVLGGVPVTTPHRTIVDLVRAYTDHSEMRGVITDAVRRDQVDLAALYDELIPLADHYEFPADGPEFAGYFLPDLAASGLSARNLRALATVVLADRVADTERALAGAMAAVPGGSRAAEQTIRALAADIVGRTERV